MAQIRVINNHTGDEGTVDETWLERWPEDFTPLGAGDIAHIAELLAAGAGQVPTVDPAPDFPESKKPSDGTTKEKN